MKRIVFAVTLLCCVALGGVAASDGPTGESESTELVQELRGIREVLERNLGATRIQAISESVATVSRSLAEDEQSLAQLERELETASLEFRMAELRQDLPQEELAIFSGRLAGAEARAAETRLRIDRRRKQLSDLESLLDEVLGEELSPEPPADHS